MRHTPSCKHSANFAPEPLEKRLLLSTHRTGHHFHYIRPAVATYVPRRGPRHAHGEVGGSTSSSTGQLTVSQHFDLTQIAGNEMESQVGVNPADPNNIAMVAQNDINAGTAINYSVTTDGGLTWDRITIGSEQDGFSATTTRADARIIFDAFGNLYAVYMVSPAEGQTAIVCLHSFDAGQHLAAVTIPVPAGTYNPDSPWLATGPDASDPTKQHVWMSFTDHISMRVMVTGIASSGLGEVGSWSTPSIVSDGYGTYSSLAVGPKGEIAVAWQKNEFGQAPTPLLFEVDPTGTGDGFGSDQNVLTTNVGGYDPIPAQSFRTIDAEVKLAFDRSGGPTNGRLYFAYTDEPIYESNDTNIYLRYSDNLGSTWSRSTKVNDDTGAKSQFLPSLAVDQSTGNVALTWYDSRNSPDNTGAELFGTVSTDHGLSFAPDLQIAGGMSNQAWKAYSSNNLDYGDNGSADFLNGKLVAVWSDNSNSDGNNPEGGQLNQDVDCAIVTLE